MRDKRKNDELRDIRITPGFLSYPKGSVLIEMGETKVICTASYEDKVPKFLEGKNSGWITAEYSMLPGSTQTRKSRDIKSLKLDGRSTEIQRLIGRALRSSVNLNDMPGVSIVLDCDVIQADGGTRCASITGAFIALDIAVKKLMEEGILKTSPIISKVAAVSVGIVEDEICLDLEYSEDSKAQVDMNVVMNDRGEFIEIQGTGEGRGFTREESDKLLNLASLGINEIFRITGDKR